MQGSLVLTVGAANLDLHEIIRDLWAGGDQEAGEGFLFAGNLSTNIVERKIQRPEYGCKLQTNKMTFRRK